jgi:hypothetical protein
MNFTFLMKTEIFRNIVDSVKGMFQLCVNAEAGHLYKVVARN